MQRIALDMDEVLVDTLTAQVDWFRRAFGYTFTRADLDTAEQPPGGYATGAHGLELLVRPEHCAAHEEALHEGSFFGDLPAMPGAIEAVRRLGERYELFVVSAATEFPRSFIHKFEWLRRHLPEIPPSHIVFCGDKSIVAAEWLVDDHPHHFARFRGEGLLFDAPHNRHHEGYRRVRTWAEVEQVFLAGPAGTP